MTTMKRAALSALACLAMSLGSIPAAQALMVDLRQSTPSEGLLDVNVVFTGLQPGTPGDYASQEIITAYTLVVLTYTYQALTPISLTFNSAAAMPRDYEDDSVTTPPGPRPDLTDGMPGRVAFSALSFASDAELKLLQGGLNEFNALTIRYAITTLLPSYEFFFLYSIPDGIDIKGADNIPYQVNATPEPTPLALLALGALALRLRRRC